MDAMPFPHLASLAYFQTSSTLCTTPILRPEPPTPRKMMSIAPVCSPMAHRRRRYSGIPRPSSGSSRRALSSNQKPLALGDVSSMIAVSPSPCDPNQARHLPLKSREVQGDIVCENRDLSGVRQQLNVRNFSTKSAQGLEVFSSPRNTAVRSLMRPLGPPLPRSHTMGDLTSNRHTSSPVHKEEKEEYLSLCGSNASSEIDVVDALHESRMSQEEVKLFNRIEREKEFNKLGLSRTMGAARMMSFPSHVSQTERNVDALESPWLSTPGSAMSRTVFQEHLRRRTADVKGVLRIDASLANSSRTPSLLTPKSALSTFTSTEEIDPRNVYFAEPTVYWTGRFIALCDKSKTQHVARVVSIAGRQKVPESDEYGIDQQESFETTERRRARFVLEDLRSCCQSELALKSFEKFEDLLLIMKSGTSIQTIKPEIVTTTPPAGATEMPNTFSKLRHPWLFGSTLAATTVGSGNASVSKTLPSHKTLPITEKANGLVKSKTTGNLTEYHVSERKSSANGSGVVSGDKMQHSRHPSNLSMQAQMNARALREREERATRRAEETKRRVNSTSFSNISGLAHPIVRRTEKTQYHPSSEKMEVPGGQVNPSPRRRVTQEVRKQTHAGWPSLVTTNSADGLDKRFSNHSENRNTSVTLTRLQAKHGEEALGVELQMSAPRELQRRTNRQISGEMLKSMVTGGLKGVRRMGRSLTGRSELEEVDQPFGSDLHEERWGSQNEEVGAAF